MFDLSRINSNSTKPKSMRICWSSKIKYAIYSMILDYPFMHTWTKFTSHTSKNIQPSRVNSRRLFTSKAKSTNNLYLKTHTNLDTRTHIYLDIRIIIPATEGIIQPYLRWKQAMNNLSNTKQFSLCHKCSEKGYPPL